MKQFLFIILFASFLPLAAQVQTIEGQLTDRSGNPLVRTEFRVDNRNIQGRTDRNGNFVLRNVLPTDVIRADGRTFVVSDVTTSVLSVAETPAAPQNLFSRTDAVGVRFVPPDQHLVRYRGNIGSIWAFISRGDSVFKITERAATRDAMLRGTFTTSIEGATVGRLPQLQSRYGQSESGSDIGGFPSELFSWGNPIGGTAHDATDFFRTGISFGNRLNLFIRNEEPSENILIGLGQQRNNSPIPNVFSELYNASLSVRNIETGRFTSTAGVMYRHSFDRLPQHGSNWSSLLYSVLTTPPSFNNSANESQSYAPGLVHNPFWLARNMLDKNQSDYLLAYARTNIRLGRRHNRNTFANALLSFDREWNERTNGIVLPAETQSVHRREVTSNTIAAFDFTHRINNNVRVTPFSYGFRRTTTDLDVTPSGNFRPAAQYELARNAQDIRYSIQLTYSDFFIMAEGGHYFSNTLSRDTYTNFFPRVNFNWNMSNALDDLVGNITRRNHVFPHRLNLHGAFSSSIGEAPLLYRNNAVFSTVGSACDFRHSFDDLDFVFDERNHLNAEIFTQRNVGLRFNNRNRRGISAEINYFNNRTDDFILPVAVVDGSDTHFQLQNAGAVRHSGFDFGVSYRNWIGGTRFNAQLNLARSRRTVIDVFGDAPFLPMAGFSDIATVFAENQPLGVIFGTTFLRDADGNFVFDGNGAQMIDSELRKIGDPTPDFVLSFAPSFDWDGLVLSFSMEYSHGGQRWNGTRAYLDFLGMSEQSSINRNALTMTGFTHHGATGVGEAYIEDASFFRLANINLSYTFEMRNNRWFNEIRVNAAAHNLFLLTRYQGVEPNSRLFGNSVGAGLDLFNMPSMRSYSLGVTFQF